jgi:ATP-dependent DNA ligase
MNGSAATIETSYGQLNSEKTQTTRDTVHTGKNVGKKNETTPFEQACAEAQSKWEKQKKKGYVDSIKGAEANEVDDIVEGGLLPMLAHKFSEQGHKIKFPCYVQPKLDGIRCIAILRNGKCTLWSRTRKQIKSCPHIVAEIESKFTDDIILDGELYNHEFKKNFEHIVHLVRQDKKPDPQCTDVQYHVYDTVDRGTFYQRTVILTKCFLLGNPQFDYLKLVETYEIREEFEIELWFNEFKKKGYEGAMLRNAGAKYHNKRSYDLQKVKEFDDAEFEICGIEEGRGKLQGHVGAFKCKTRSGTEFLAKMSGDTDRLRDYFENHKLWKGKKLTVKYQGLTGAANVPRFPVGVAIRDYE